MLEMSGWSLISPGLVQARYVADFATIASVAISFGLVLGCLPLVIHDVHAPRRLNNNTVSKPLPSEVKSHHYVAASIFRMRSLPNHREPQRAVERDRRSQLVFDPKLTLIAPSSLAFCSAANASARPMPRPLYAGSTAIRASSNWSGPSRNKAATPTTMPSMFAEKMCPPSRRTLPGSSLRWRSIASISKCSVIQASFKRMKSGKQSGLSRSMITGLANTQVQHIITISAKPHPKSACQLQHSLRSGRGDAWTPGNQVTHAACGG